MDDKKLPTTKKKWGRPIEWTEERIEEKRIALEKWINNPNNYFFTSFLNQEDLFNEQIIRFCQLSERFRSTYSRALAIQEARIVEGSMTRKFDGNFAKFVLQNKAAWRERQEISGDQANPLAVIMDRIADSAKDTIEYNEQ